MFDGNDEPADPTTLASATAPNAPVNPETELIPPIDDLSAVPAAAPKAAPPTNFNNPLRLTEPPVVKPATAPRGSNDLKIGGSKAVNLPNED